MNLLEKIESNITPELATALYELVDLQLLTEDGRKVIRVFVDKDGGIRLEDCAKVSHLLGDKLDVAMPELGDYVIEVSSPGLDRVIKTEKDFNKFMGKRVKITVFAPIEGQRSFVGPIVSCANGTVEIDDESGKRIAIEMVKMARARLDPDFSK